MHTTSSATGASAQVAAPEVSDHEVLDGLEREMRTLGRFTKLLRSRTNPVGAGHDELTYVLLAHLDLHGPERAGELAAFAGLDASTMSRRVAALVREGLIERVPDADDRRACLLRPTPTGVDLLNTIRARHRTLLSEIVMRWSPDDRRDLLRLLTEFNSTIPEGLLP